MNSFGWKLLLTRAEEFEGAFHAGRPADRADRLCRSPTTGAMSTNLDREDGEEDIPDWFFEEGPIFLPEELEAHLRLPDRALRRLFREAHGELLTVEYWTRMQRLLGEGKVPRVRTYPRSTQLRLPETEAANAS